MRSRYYVDLIRRAADAQDTTTIEALAVQLEDCENARQILRAKGYGEPGMSAAMTARLVPDNK